MEKESKKKSEKDTNLFTDIQKKIKKSKTNLNPNDNIVQDKNVVPPEKMVMSFPQEDTVIVENKPNSLKNIDIDYSKKKTTYLSPNKGRNANNIKYIADCFENNRKEEVLQLGGGKVHMPRKEKISHKKLSLLSQKRLENQIINNTQLNHLFTNNNKRKEKIRKRPTEINNTNTNKIQKKNNFHTNHKSLLVRKKKKV